MGESQAAITGRANRGVVLFFWFPTERQFKACHDELKKRHANTGGFGHHPIEMIITNSSLAGEQLICRVRCSPGVQADVVATVKLYKGEPE